MQYIFPSTCAKNTKVAKLLTNVKTYTVQNSQNAHTHANKHANTRRNMHICILHCQTPKRLFKVPYYIVKTVQTSSRFFYSLFSWFSKRLDKTKQRKFCEKVKQSGGSFIRIYLVRKMKFNWTSSLDISVQKELFIRKITKFVQFITLRYHDLSFCC